MKHLKSGKEPKLTAAEVASGIGLLALFCYTAGYTRLFFFYREMGCEWAIGLHSFQEVVSQGVINVMSSCIVAVLMFYAKDDVRYADGYGLRSPTLFISGVFTSVIVADWLGYPVHYVVMETIIAFCFYGFLGVLAASVAKQYIEDKETMNLVIGILTFIIVTVYAPFQYYSGLGLKALAEQGRFPLVENRNGEQGLLLGYLSGRYLIKLCSSSNEFRIAGQTEDWLIKPMGYIDCNVAH